MLKSPISLCSIFNKKPRSQFPNYRVFGVVCKTRFEITVISNDSVPNSPLLLWIHKLDSRKALIIVGNGLTFLQDYIVFDSCGQLFRSKDFFGSRTDPDPSP